MTEFVSIIVPFYNAKSYLERCVYSVSDQTHPHFELLLIDDGSEDGSGEIARELCRPDRRFRLISTPHRGVSAARNAGMEAAKGKYLFFLDADDTIHPRLLEVLVELCEVTGAALAMEMYRLIEETAPQGHAAGPDREESREWSYLYVEAAEAIRKFSSRGNPYNLHGIGGKMFRHSEVGSLRFDEKRGNGEDTVFLYEFLNKGKDVVFLRERWYDYWYRPDGASRQLKVQTCRDIYECMTYISAREQEQGRMENARTWAEFASFRLRQAYVRSWKERSREVFTYVKTLGRNLRTSGQYALLTSGERRKNFIAYYCFPLYLPLHKAAVWIWKMRKRIADGGNEGL